MSSNGAVSSGANVPQNAAKTLPNVSAVTVEPSDQNLPRVARTVRGMKPGLRTSLFVGACLLIGVGEFWSASNADSECAEHGANARE